MNISDKHLLTFFTQASRKNQSHQTYIQDLLQQLAKRITSQVDFSVNIEDKVALGEEILSQAIETYPFEKLAVAWTGGKDSTLIIWMLQRVLKKKKLDWPKVVLINEGEMFEEMISFVKDLSKDWNFSYEEVKNDDVLQQASKVGDQVVVTKLNKRNQTEIKRLGFDKAEFPFEPESMVGNHLMKTVVQNLYLEKYQVEALITGIRWDEQEARADERYFSNRGDEHTPRHVRVHPILHFTEADIWEAHHHFSIPYCSLYEQGYRSLGAKTSTNKTSDVPAWQQDLDNTTEREGRNQDKEEIMQRLRDLGYM